MRTLHSLHKVDVNAGTYLRVASWAAVARCGTSACSSSRSSYGRSGLPWPKIFARLPDMMAVPGLSARVDEVVRESMFWSPGL